MCFFSDDDARRGGARAGARAADVAGRGEPAFARVTAVPTAAQGRAELTSICSTPRCPVDYEPKSRWRWAIPRVSSLGKLYPCIKVVHWLSHRRICATQKIPIENERRCACVRPSATRSRSYKKNQRSMSIPSLHAQKVTKKHENDHSPENRTGVITHPGEDSTHYSA